MGSLMLDNELNAFSEMHCIHCFYKELLQKERKYNQKERNKNKIEIKWNL